MLACVLTALALAGPTPAQQPAATDPVQGSFDRAERLTADGRASDALLELEAAAHRLKPSDPRLIRYHERKGSILLSENDLPAAEESFNKAIALAKQLKIRHSMVADAYAGLGICQMRQSRYSYAIDNFKEGLQEGPGEETRDRIEQHLKRSRKNLPNEEAPENPNNRVRCTRINFYGNRTDEAVLRRHLPFTEGDMLDSSSLDDARSAMYQMRHFKKVDVSSSPAEFGGAEVAITVSDGWYVIPLPVVSAGSGGGHGGLVIQERNYLSMSESLVALGMIGQIGRRYMLEADWEGFSLKLESTRRDYLERAYGDGGFTNASGFGSPLDLKTFNKYGLPTTSYKKHQESVLILAEVPIFYPLFVSAGLDQRISSYAEPQPSAPSDAGRLGALFVGMKIGSLESFGGEALGVIFGYGLAGLEERIKPLSHPVFDWGLGAQAFRASQLANSNFDFGYGILRGSAALIWGQYQSLSVFFSGGHGYSLPASMLLGTGSQTALQGTYAREFRGESAGGVSVIYSNPIWMSRWGVLQASLFAEDARAWSKGLPQRDKQGIGGSISFRNWRFPVPIGIGYTYSRDDKDSQVGGAIGGRF